MEIYLLCSIWHHWPSDWHTEFTNKYLLNRMDLPCSQKPSVTLTILTPYAFFLPFWLFPFNLLFYFQSLIWKHSLLLLSRLPPLLPELTTLGTLSYFNYCLHADVSQIYAICIPVSVLKVKLTWSSLLESMSHMHSKSICPKFNSSLCL